MTIKRVFTVFAMFIGVIVLLIGALLAWMTWQRGNDGQHRETVGEQNAWVQEYMLRNLRSIAREGEGVRIQAAEPDRQILYRAAADPKNSNENMRRGHSVLLFAGDVMVNPDYHGGQTYTIRQLLPDKIIVDYYSSHNIMGNSSIDSGTVELEYRTSTPLNTQNVNYDLITQQLAKQIKSLQPVTDDKAVEIITASPQEFSIRSVEVRHRMDKKIADRIKLAVDDSIVFSKQREWTMVSVKEILPEKVVFEYRTAFEYKGMKAQDTGRLEIAYRR